MGGKTKNKMLLDVGSGGLASVLDVQLFFLLKKIAFATWLEIMLSQISIYYWQEIFFLTLTSDSEVILYHCIVCGLNRAKECVDNLNMTWLGFVFVLHIVYLTLSPHIVNKLWISRKMKKPNNYDKDLNFIMKKNGR